MLERICPKCNVPMEGDRCTKKDCGCKTISSVTLYWCKKCNIPTYEQKCQICDSDTFYIARDMRPVFPEESLLLGLLFQKEDPHCFEGKSVWNTNNGYLVDGDRLKLSISEINKWSLDRIKTIKEKYNEAVNDINYQYFNENTKKFVEANKNHFNAIKEEATTYIRGFLSKYSIEDMFVSFSGGKDSTVTSHLVNTALGTNKVLHIFGDTTLEFPYTYEYKKRFKENEESRGIRIITAKNREKNFEQLCEVIGPPSRVMRWCCTVFKTGAIQKTIAAAFKDKTNVLTFYGIRRSESASRSKYERETELRPLRNQ